MKHPLQTIPNKWKPLAFLILIALTIVTMLVLNLTGTILRTAEAPSGIISYEFAGTVDRAQSILASWSPRARIFAGFNIGLDYLFLFAYSTTIALAAIWVGKRLNPRYGFWKLLAVLLAWSLWGAAVLDAVENYALFTMLVNGASEPWPQVAWISALVKFAIVIIGISYVLVGLAAGYLLKNQIAHN